MCTLISVVKCNLLLHHELTVFTTLANEIIWRILHDLLNLLNELGKRDNMRGLPSILSLFRNEFNKVNNTRARMLDSIYHMTNILKSAEKTL